MNFHLDFDTKFSLFFWDFMCFPSVDVRARFLFFAKSYTKKNATIGTWRLKYKYSTYNLISTVRCVLSFSFRISKARWRYGAQRFYIYIYIYMSYKKHKK